MCAKTLIHDWGQVKDDIHIKICIENGQQIPFSNGTLNNSHIFMMKRFSHKLPKHNHEDQISKITKYYINKKMIGEE